MYKLCKTEASAARQRKLEAGLLHLLQTCRFEEISVADLCDRLHIPRKAFYRYFDGKEGALQALVDHTILEHASFVADIQSEGASLLRKELERFFLYWFHQRPLLDALHRNGRSVLLMQRAIVLAEMGIMILGYSSGGEDASVRRHGNMFSICGLMAMVLRWHREEYRESAVQMAQTAEKLLTAPLVPYEGG